MDMIIPNRLSLFLPALAGGLLLMATPIHAEKDNAYILAADPSFENSRRIDRDKNDKALTEAGQKRGIKALKIRADFRKTPATDESSSLNPPLGLRIINDPR